MTNGTSKPISRAFFRGVLATPERSVPWLEEDFNYSISGGIEPGETAVWSLQPGYGGGWRSVEIKPDAIFEVSVSDLFDHEGKSITEAEKFSDGDAKRLKLLVSL